MPTYRLTPAARQELRWAGIPVAAFCRRYFVTPEGATPTWRGDWCGCSDDRCIGYHHDEREQCGCLPVQIEQYLADAKRVTA